MKYSFGFFLSIFFSLHLLAQSYNPIAPPNTFRSADNPHYWGNKKPYSDYWQQDVHYTIHATIDEKTDIIAGKEKLVYWNNSPDTLYRVYFHVYQNAFQPGSYLDDLHQANHIHPHYGKYESQGLGTEVTHIAIDGKVVKTELDNTIMIVYLNEPILPNTSVTFDIEFKTYYDTGTVRRRMKKFNSYGAKQFNGCHWYPRIAVYDKKFGWSTNQHLGREFYGDFGTYDITLNFASNYIVAATGKLQNEDEVLPAELRAQLDLRNFANKPWGEAPSIIIPYKQGERKEWRFYAENVHDFAFTANPHYRIGEAEWTSKDGVTIKTYAFVQEPHASGWQNAAEYTAKIVQVFSEDIGMYGYHKMIVADARDGMEYPMLTLCGGSDPGYRGLLAHEVGHNWFYGMVNSNETYRAFMDEGFTQFITAWAQEKIDGINHIAPEPKSAYVKKFRKETPIRDRAVYYGYMRDACVHRDPPLNTHSDGFGGALRHGGGYGHVYYKTAVMLYALQYVLGDDLFKEAMQYYFQKWSFVHPYPEDFRQSIIEYTKVDLNWFFDQWLETTKTVDYRVGKVKRVDGEHNTFDITFKRKGRMQMPIDFRVMDHHGRTFDYHIPNQYFVKKTDAEVLPKWTGWDKLRPTYTARVAIPDAYEGKKLKLAEVEIDPSFRIADAHILDNSNPRKVDWNFDSHVWNFPEWKKYQVYYRPDIWWNGYDGFKVGWHMNGNYLNSKHKFHLTTWFNTRLLQGNIPAENAAMHETTRVNYNFKYETALDKFMPYTTFELKSRYLDGLVLNQAGISRDFEKNVTIHFNFKSMYRHDESDLNYLLFPNEWITGEWNNSVNAGMKYRFKPGVGDASAVLDVNARASASGFYNYQYLETSYVADRKLWRFDLKTRLYGRVGTGNNLAPESALFFAGANPEEMMENKYVRSAGFYPSSWVGSYGDATNHFQYGGGLNMRGYAGYYLVELDNAGNTVQAYTGSSGMAVNMELAFNRLVKLKKLPKIKRMFDFDSYLFGDAGTIVYRNSDGNNQFSKLRMDAGVGASLTIKRWGNLYNIKPLTLRFDMPLYLSHTPATENNFQFRWLVGINKAF
jgi:hypothetical protein